MSDDTKTPCRFLMANGDDPPFPAPRSVRPSTRIFEQPVSDDPDRPGVVTGVIVFRRMVAVSLDFDLFVEDRDA